MESYWDWLPSEIQNVIFKMVHKLLLSDVHKQMNDEIIHYWPYDDGFSNHVIDFFLYSFMYHSTLKYDIGLIIAVFGNKCLLTKKQKRFKTIIEDEIIINKKKKAKNINKMFDHYDDFYQYLKMMKNFEKNKMKLINDNYKKLNKLNEALTILNNNNNTILNRQLNSRIDNLKDYIEQHEKCLSNYVNKIRNYI